METYMLSWTTILEHDLFYNAYVWSVFSNTNNTFRTLRTDTLFTLAPLKLRDRSFYLSFYPAADVALRTSYLSVTETFPQGGCTCYSIVTMAMAMASMAPLTGPLLRPFANTLRLIPHLLLPPRNHINRTGAYCDYTSNPATSIRRRKFVLFLVQMGSCAYGGTERWWILYVEIKSLQWYICSS